MRLYVTSNPRMRFSVKCAFPHLGKRGVASRKSAFWAWALTEKRILAVGRICLLGFRLRPSRKTVWGSWQRERSTKGLSRNSMHCHSAVSVRTSVQRRAAMRAEATF